MAERALSMGVPKAPKLSAAPSRPSSHRTRGDLERSGINREPGGARAVQRKRELDRGADPLALRPHRGGGSGGGRPGSRSRHSRRRAAL